MSCPVSENRFSKDHQDILPYGLDWQAWLDREGFEGTPSFAWDVPDALRTEMDPFTQVVAGHLVAGVWLRHGESGRSYRVYCTITAGSKVARKSIVVEVT